MTNIPLLRVDLPFFEQWRKLNNCNAQASVRGHYCTIDLCLYYGDTPWLLPIKEGKLLRVEQGPWHMRSADISVRASESTWQQFWAPVPPPGFHDLFAMSSYGHARIEGDMALLRAHLGFIKCLFAAPRLIMKQEAQDAT